MINGYYVIKDGDKEIVRSNNLITNMGKRHILEYLANKVANRSRYIGIGIGTTAANVADKKLQFEINKYPVYSYTIDYQNSTIIMKAELPLQLAATISELGLFPGSAPGRDSDSKIITFFNNDIVWSNGSYQNESANSKINSTSFKIEASSGGTVSAVSSNLAFDFTNYSVDDSFSIAFYQADENLDYIDLIFYSSDTDYYTYRIEGTASAAHRVVDIPLGNLFGSNTGSPNENIIKFGISVKANSGQSTSVDFDGMRINDNDTYVLESGVISRAVLATPIVKEFGRILDLEYRMVFN